ncbi:MAG: protoheme IX farnesyltransferase [Thermoanaerobaculia bacterium]|nr:MAG: protoheme IX farnesyltransferase [Thermoanaerobaculia bacterium]MBZ0103914.1 heme o synthase [Thermoanaerobaculia bacterium]
MRAAPAANPSRAADLLELTKPRITGLVTVTAAAGFLLGLPAGELPWGRFVAAVAGIALVSAGSASLNHWWERELDRRMRRTARRPLPAGRMVPDTALLWGALLASAGILGLTFLVEPLTAVLAAATLVSYVFVYTPMKTRTSLATIVGAVPGAAPTILGWTAATGEIALGGWILFAILFLWQLPHFLSIAWLYREDYRAAGMRLLTIDDPDFGRTARQAALWTVALLPVSLLPSAVGLAGVVYLAGAALCGGLFLGVALAFARGPAVASARRLLLASVSYLPLLLTILVLDHRFLTRWPL